MVDFEVPDEIKILRRNLREFIEREVEPREEELSHLLEDDRHMLTDEGFLEPEVQEAIEEIREASAEAGYYAMHMPEAEGGSGISNVGKFFAWKEVMSHGMGLNLSVLASVEGPTPLFLEMTEEQKERWLHPMIRGEETSAFCLTEPQAGSDVANIQATAERDGNGYVLDGTKQYITNGPYADHYQVFAKTDPDEGLGGISCFMVERDNPGLQVGDAQNTIVNDGEQCEIILDGARVPEEHRVGDEGGGFWLAIQNIGDTRVQIGGMCVGLAQFCLDEAVDYAQQREAFGKPIGKMGQIQHKVSEMATKLYTAENLTLNCCWKLDEGQDITRESSMVKLYTTEMLEEVASHAMQIHGGLGVMRELPLERIYRFGRMLQVPEGTSEIQRRTIAQSYGL